jgi:hypothetical protein
VYIQLKTNFTNTLAGFAIRWNGVYASTQNSYSPNQTTGWYYDAAKNYMRGGLNINNNWSPDSSGLFSFAFGYNNIAKGNYSTAMGNGTSASGTNSTAIGITTKASGISSTSIGNTTMANGAYSTAMGDFTQASGYASTAMGSSSIAIGNYSTAIGNVTNASGYSSTAMGSSSIASGSYSIAMGSSTTASGYGSTAMGNTTKASGYISTAIGLSTTASGDYSTALGNNTIASGANSAAMGQITSASGTNSTAMGYSTKSKSYGGLSIGLYNDSTNAANATNLNALNRIFEIGNGTANNVRSNALTVLQNGKIGIGLTSPLTLLDVNGDASFNDKTILLRTGADLNHGIRYDATVDGPYIFGFLGGALGTSGYQNALTWTWDGKVNVLNSFTVQNGKGIIRSTDGTQKKELSTNVLVNVSLTAGATSSINFTFPESFSSVPDVYVGNVISGTSGWAEVIMTIANVSTTGGTLYVHNSTNGTWNPNFTVKVIAIGPQ